MNIATLADLMLVSASETRARWRIRCHSRAVSRLVSVAFAPSFIVPHFVGALLNGSRRPWRSRWGVSGGSLRSPGKDGLARENALLIFDDAAGLRPAVRRRARVQ